MVLETNEMELLQLWSQWTYRISAVTAVGNMLFHESLQKKQQDPPLGLIVDMFMMMKWS